MVIIQAGGCDGEPDSGGEWPIGAFYGEGSDVEMRGGGVADASVACFC